MAARYGLQLYTLRDECARDLAGTVAFVAACGYAGVEVAAQQAQRRARRARAARHARAGRGVASRVALGRRRGARSRRCRGAGRAALLVVPFAHPDRFASASGVAALADELNAACAHAHERRLRLGYHNHFWEWRALEVF